MLYTLLIVVLVLAIVGMLPSWPHSKGWGWSPAAIVLVILVVWLLLGRDLG